MKDEKDYIKDISEIRSMMERSSKFLSLAGWAGIMAGVYALGGAYYTYSVIGFNPQVLAPDNYDNGIFSSDVRQVIHVALTVLVFAIGTAIILSKQKAHKRSEKLWNATSRRLLFSMSVPLVSGGLLILIMIANGLTGLIAPLSLIFYGLSLFNASRFTFEDIKTLGLIQIVLGLLGCYFVEYSLLFWAIGFGLTHIIYGIYIHYKYEK